MMEGIEILSQTEIMKMGDPTMERIAIILIIISLFLFLIGIFFLVMERPIFCVFIIISFISFFVGLVFVINSCNTSIPTGQYEYKVTIDDNVSLTEFIGRYEIISQDGKIYTIIEKEE